MELQIEMMIVKLCDPENMCKPKAAYLTRPPVNENWNT